MRQVLVLATCLAAIAGGAAAQPLDDAQIAAVVVAANHADMQAGELALSVSKNPTVRRFAMRMITDHMAANRAASNLVARLGLTPRENEASQALQEAGKRSLDALRQLTGAEFDGAYLAHEVAFHEEVIATLDDVLIPRTKNPELASLLRKVRPNFDIHLEHARHAQSSLSDR
jgi:putative membrane protein